MPEFDDEKLPARLRHPWTAADLQRHLGECSCGRQLADRAFIRSGEIAIRTWTPPIGGLDHLPGDCTASADVVPGDGVSLEAIAALRSKLRGLVFTTFEFDAKQVVGWARAHLGQEVEAEGRALLSRIKEANSSVTGAQSLIDLAGNSLPPQRRAFFEQSARNAADAEAIALTVRSQIDGLHAKWAKLIDVKVRSERATARALGVTTSEPSASYSVGSRPPAATPAAMGGHTGALRDAALGGTRGPDDMA